ncbi:type II toxin-antitoxin system VapC family toxin [Nocardia zapadnayensis]|uniref:type II toxin-antitoxin system VapC family toxin n=1 Tax=Nocardia rhamnosiphila TaxID=426716 RepID=UPI0022483683|nr:type II toxin-antitoxin system VapC family toxin [Nocardia zapadnayensis]MCX0271225.1 type II toxin-antitoxin system VapC family toxin [Nocardia zapadnayensis]
MIVADTNVVSELFKPTPDTRVLSWLEKSTDITITTVTIGEIWAGIENLPEGTRKAGLVTLATDLFDEFGDEVETYDSRAARAYGRIVATRRRIGRPIGYADAQIAAICLVNDCPVATRNVKDFTDLGITIINPWQPTPDSTLA